jgi:hypothetical protein
LFNKQREKNQIETEIRYLNVSSISWHSNILFSGPNCPEGKFLFTKFEFGGRFGMSLMGDCNELEVTLNLKLFVTFGMSLEGVYREHYIISLQAHT